jgi:hypothetical protein
MRAITVRQPWAWAIVHGGKNVENRTRNIAGSYRGPVAIHAGVGPFEQHNQASEALKVAHGSETPSQVVFGAVIGVVDLVDVHRAHPDSGTRCGGLDDMYTWQFCSSWGMAGHFHLVLENPRPLRVPVRARGQLGLWRPDEAVRSAITYQLGGA